MVLVWYSRHALLLDNPQYLYTYIYVALIIDL